MFHDMGCQGRKIYLLLETQNATKHYRLACPGRGGLHFGSGGRRTGWVSTSGEGATGPAKAATSGGAGGKTTKGACGPAKAATTDKGGGNTTLGRGRAAAPGGRIAGGRVGGMGKLLILT